MDSLNRGPKEKENVVQINLKKDTIALLVWVESIEAKSSAAEENETSLPEVQKSKRMQN